MTENARVEVANAYVVGEWLVVAAVTGFGGGYREMEGWERVRIDDPNAEAVLEGQLARSDIRPEALSRPSRPVRKTAFAEARRLSKGSREAARLFRVSRQGGDITVFVDRPAPDGRGFVGDRELRIRSLREFWSLLALPGGVH